MHNFLNRTLKATDQSERKRTNLRLEALDGKCITSPIVSLRKHTSLSLRAPDVQMADFLIESLRGQSSLSLEAPEVQMHDFLNRILKETDQSDLGSSRGLNA